MRGSVANLLRVGVMIALVAMGVLVLYGRPEEPPPEPEPAPPRWSDLSEVVAAWERLPLELPAAPAGCGYSVAIDGVCGEADGSGVLSGGEGSCARAAGRWVFELAPGTTGMVACTLGPCTSRSLNLKDGGVADPRVTRALMGCSER